MAAHDTPWQLVSANSSNMYDESRSTWLCLDSSAPLELHVGDQDMQSLVTAMKQLHMHGSYVYDLPTRFRKFHLLCIVICM